MLFVLLARERMRAAEEIGETGISTITAPKITLQFSAVLPPPGLVKITQNGSMRDSIK